MTHVALEISNSNIKILELRGGQVKKCAATGLNAGLVRDGLVTDPSAAAGAIRELFRSSGIRRENVTACLAGLPFIYRFLSLPEMKTGLLEEAIMRAAKKEMSLPPEEMYLSWQRLPGKPGEQAFFVLGVSRLPVDAFVKTAGLAGIEPVTLDIHPLALARASSRRDAIAVSIEPDCFSMVFISGGIPGVIHSINPRGGGATMEDNIRRLADL